MTNWIKIAEAQGLTLSAAEAEQIQRVLSGMEESFTKAKARIPAGALMDTLGKDEAK